MHADDRLNELCTLTNQNHDNNDKNLGLHLVKNIQ